MRFLLGSILLLFFACQPANKGIKVAVAANLLLPFEEIVAIYQTSALDKVLLIPGASGSLTAQIEKGAPFDLFISANERYAKHLYKKGLSAETPINLLHGQLFLWSKNSLDSLQSDTMLDPNIKVAIADPELAPYGMAAKQYLQSHALWDKLQPNLVIGKSVGQVNQYLVSGVVDYAFTASSARSVKAIDRAGRWQRIPTEYPLTHPFLVLGSDKPAAKRFLQYLQGEEALAIFLKHGYSLTP